MQTIYFGTTEATEIHVLFTCLRRVVWRHLGYVELIIHTPRTICNCPLASCVKIQENDFKIR